MISTVGSFILAAGVLMFVVNVFYSLRRGEKAGSNPWGADTLEWAVNLPPPPYGFAELPIVHSRHPLWEQESIHRGDGPLKRMLEDLAQWPVHWRAAVTTTLLDARPTEIFRVSGPSIWPFVTAVGLIAMFAAEIFTLRILVLSGGIAVIIGLVGWHWPDSIETTERELNFERKHNIKVYPNGSPVVTRWSMWLMLTLIAICTGLFEFTYFYIRLQHDVWPLANIPSPGLVLPAIGTVALVAGAGAMYWANRQIGAGNVTGLQVALAAAFVLGALATGTVVYDLGQVLFDHSTNAYGSVYWTLTIFLVAILLGGLGQNLFTLVWSFFGRYSPREHIAVDIGALYWYGAVVFWLVLAGTVYVSPYVI
jgi:cytochrome c oxidase subunit I+III